MAPLKSRSHCLPMFLDSSSSISFNSSTDKEPSMTDERLLTTSNRTVGKSPDVFCKVECYSEERHTNGYRDGIRLSLWASSSSTVG